MRAAFRADCAAGGPGRLEPLGRIDGALVAQVARIEGGDGLQKQDVCLGVGHGFVLDTSWHDKELALVQLDDAIAQVDSEPAPKDEEQLVLALMVMPDELALELGELDVLAVELADNAGTPMLRKLLELFGEVDLFDLTIAHGGPPKG